MGCSSAILLTIHPKIIVMTDNIFPVDLDRAAVCLGVAFSCHRSAFYSLMRTIRVPYRGRHHAFIIDNAGIAIEINITCRFRILFQVCNHRIRHGFYVASYWRIADVRNRGYHHPIYVFAGAVVFSHVLALDPVQTPAAARQYPFRTLPPARVPLLHRRQNHATQD